MSTAAINNSYLARTGYQGAISGQVQQILANGASGGTATVVNTASACTDGSNDGKIGFWEGLKNFGKGIWDMGVNMVKTALKNPLKTIALIGACMIPGVGPIIATALTAYGAVTGAASLVKNGYTALTAETDAEAKAAWQNVGGAALQTGISVLGLKASLKGIARNNGVNATSAKDALTNIKETGLIQTAKNSWGVFKASKLGTSLTEIGSSFKNNGFKEGVKEIGHQLKTNTKFGSNFADGWNASKSTSKVGKFIDGVKNMAKEGGARFKENQLQRKMARDIKKGTNKTETQCQQQIDALQKQVDSYKTETVDGTTVYKKGNMTFKDQATYNNSLTQAQQQLSAAQRQLATVQETMVQARGNIIKGSETVMKDYNYDTAAKKWTDSAGKEVTDRATITKLNNAYKTYNQNSGICKQQSIELGNQYNNSVQIVDTPELSIETYDPAALEALNRFTDLYNTGYNAQGLQNLPSLAQSVVSNYNNGVTGTSSSFAYNFNQAATETGVGTFGTVSAGLVPQAGQIYSDEELAALGRIYTTPSGSPGFVYNPYLGIA